MNTSDAVAILEILKIPAAHYSVNSSGVGENWVLEMHPDGRWSSYYLERGQRTVSQTFDSEPEAAAFFLAQVLGSDPKLEVRISSLREAISQDSAH